MPLISVEQIIIIPIAPFLLEILLKSSLLDIPIRQPIEQQIRRHFLILVTRQVSLRRLNLREPQRCQLKSSTKTYSLDGLLLGFGDDDLLAFSLWLHAVVDLVEFPLTALHDHALEFLRVLGD